MTDLHIDYESFSTVDIAKCGVYRYAEEAEVILLAYRFDNGPVQQVDLLSGEPLPFDFEDALLDPSVLKYAQNANFERIITRSCLGIDVPVEQWRCTQVWAAARGLPQNLAKLSEVLNLGDKAKMKEGKALIKRFCVPRKPTKKRPDWVRNMPSDYPEEWETFKLYNRTDVEAECEVHRRLLPYPLSDEEWHLYALDQRINDAGIRVDSKLVLNAIDIATGIKARLMERAIEVTDLDNPNSRKQLLEWLNNEDIIVSDLTKDTVSRLIGTTNNEKVEELLQLRQQMAKASVSKYEAIARSVCKDGRMHGTMQFNGAGKTCRWAGRLIQPQNLPSKGLIKDIPVARDLLRDYPTLIELLYDNVPLALSSTIRPALIPDNDDELYVVADFSAIEARKVAWFAHEQWRLDLFASGGKLYETSAEKMFKLAPGSVTKKSPERQRSKVAELALAYQGWEGALIAMGALEMGLKLEELAPLALAWREASPAIVAYWGACEKAALRAVQNKGTEFPVLTDYQKVPLVRYVCDGKFLMCILPSGRRIYYAQPHVGRNDRGNMAVSYMGLGDKGNWVRMWLYGGLLVENICQASSRDSLAETIKRIWAYGLWDLIKIRFHVHDEVIASCKKGYAKEGLAKLEEIMGEPVDWAPGLLLKGDGFITSYYIKED